MALGTDSRTPMPIRRHSAVSGATAFGAPTPLLMSGDHAVVARWRRREALRRTLERRPDLLEAHPLTEEERRLLEGPEPTKKQG